MLLSNQRAGKCLPSPLRRLNSQKDTELIKSLGRLWAAAAIIAPLGAPLPLSTSGAQSHTRIQNILKMIFWITPEYWTLEIFLLRISWFRFIRFIASAIIAPLGAPLPLSLSGAQGHRIQNVLEITFWEIYESGFTRLFASASIAPIDYILSVVLKTNRP